jgi:hypothetical protein
MKRFGLVLAGSLALAFVVVPSSEAAFSGYYRIMARHSGKALTVQSASTANSANVFQWTYGGTNTNDEWEVRDIGSGYHRVIARHSGKDLTVASASTAEGANIFQYAYGGTTTNDEWALVDVGGGVYRITNRHSGKSAEVVGAGTADGADVVQRTYSGGTHQQWDVLSVGGGTSPTPTPAPTATPGGGATPTPQPTATPRPTGGTVYFQNTGLKQGWPNYPQDPQNLGRIDEVSSPVYKGSTALRFEQTYVDNSSERYHSEVTYHGSQSNGQDKYYGFAMYIPTTWHNESVKDNFQQWGTENPGGPWLLMWIDQQNLMAGHPNTFGTTNFGSFSKGVWMTTVARLRMQDGVPFEFWVNGTRRGAPNCTCSANGGSVRWSAGIYVSYWYDRYRSGLPSGSQRVRYLLQDHYRIASSYAAADPANW